MTLSVQFSPDTEDKLEWLAQKTAHSQAVCVKEMIEKHIDDEIAFHKADAITKAIRSGEMRTYSLDELKASLCGK